MSKGATKPPVSQRKRSSEAGSRGEVYTLHVAGMEPVAPREMDSRLDMVR